MKKNSIKNYALVLLPLISMIPSFLVGNKTRYSLGIFIERSTRIDFFAKYYSWSITFLVIAYCWMYSDGVDERVKEFLFAIAVLDMAHIILFSMRGFGLIKILIAFSYIDIKHNILRYD